MRNQHQLYIGDPSVSLAYLWKMLHGRRLALAVVLLVFSAESATALVVPLLIGRIIDQLTLNGVSQLPDGFLYMGAAILCAALAAGLFAWVGGVGISRITETLIAEIREEYVGAALRLPRATIETTGTGDVVTRASDDMAQLSGTMPDVLPRFFISIFTVAMIGGTMTTIDWRFLLIFVGLIPLYVVHIRWYLDNGPPIYRKQRAVESTRGQHILGTLDNMDTVKVHQLASHQLEKISVSSWNKVRWAVRTRIVQNRLFGRLNFSQAIGMISVLALGVWLAFAGEVTPGAVTAAALLFQRIIGPIQGLVYVMDDFQDALTSLGRIVGVIKQPQEESANLKHRQALRPGVLVGIRDMDFAYPQGHHVLKSIDLEIIAGETVAVVGATGSGKSTLAALIAGVYGPSQGEIKRSIDTSDIYSLSQETHVFMGTVRENLTLAQPAATDEEIMQALLATGAYSFVMTLPEGLDTEVGHGARRLEPSQAQHLALARLSLLDPPLVILDEATAEADSADAEALDRASAVITKKNAAFVIAHRLSQAARSDRIVVMDAGRIIESGSHENLLEAEGRYAELWRAWTAGANP